MISKINCLSSIHSCAVVSCSGLPVSEREEQLSLETERYQRNLTQSKSRVQELEQQVTTLQVWPLSNQPRT